MQIKKYISQSLAETQAVKDSQRHHLRRSAVALVIDADHLMDASVLMIQRAVHEGDPWSGQMAFPGGRQEAQDPNAVATAKREMREEVGFDIDALHASGRNADGVIGRLSDINTSSRNLGVDLVVSPYVFLIDKQPVLAPNYEVADTVWIPLSYFADFGNRTVQVLERNGGSVVRPCYCYSGDKIVWGMSLEMIDELLAALGYQIPEFAE